jgi:hypothetical protein
VNKPEPSPWPKGFLEALEHGYRRARACALEIPQPSGLRKLPGRKKILRKRMRAERRLNTGGCPQTVPREFK